VSDSKPVWVFGYGSLIWRVDFPYLEKATACVHGWSRRFWQGSHDHRGMPHAPGRVVTLIPAPLARVDGVAYLVEHHVFDHLDYREKNGYERHDVTLEWRDRPGHSPGVMYIAAQNNHAFLGPASIDEIASHIRRSSGPSGSNVEYLFELANALRALNTNDPHVFALESAVKESHGR
jgi:cation transport regulator ChaC